MTCYDRYNVLCLSWQASPINLAKTKISTLKASQLNIFVSDTQNKSGFFSWIWIKQFLKSLYKGQWNTKWNSSSTTPISQKTQKRCFSGIPSNLSTSTANHTEWVSFFVNIILYMVLGSNHLWFECSFKLGFLTNVPTLTLTLTLPLFPTDL